MTYPRLPQPIMTAPSGINWFLELTNAGVLQAGGTTTDAITGAKRTTLVSTDRSKSYQFGLSAANPPLITVSEVAIHQGGYEDLFVFSPNGKEWAVQVSGAGAVSVKALSDTSRIADPILTDPFGKKWHFTVANTGIYSVTDESITGPAVGNSVSIVSQNGDKAFIITVATSGIVSVDEISAVPEDANFEVELISPDGTKWVLIINENGILSISDTPSPVAVREIWTVVMARDNKTLYVVDPRFRNPFKGSRGWKSG